MLRPDPRLRSIFDQNGAVILDVANDSLITLDSIGAYVWRKLQHGSHVNAIVADLARDTGAAQYTIADDVDRFLDELRSRHLVVAIDEHINAGEL